jgi:hypothetical protein
MGTYTENSLFFTLATICSALSLIFTRVINANKIKCWLWYCSVEKFKCPLGRILSKAFLGKTRKRDSVKV